MKLGNTHLGKRALMVPLAGVSIIGASVVAGSYQPTLEEAAPIERQSAITEHFSQLYHADRQRTLGALAQTVAPEDWWQALPLEDRNYVLHQHLEGLSFEERQDLFSAQFDDFAKAKLEALVEGVDGKATYVQKRLKDAFAPMTPYQTRTENYDRLEDFIETLSGGHNYE